jgi:hypothetical protein
MEKQLQDQAGKYVSLQSKLADTEAAIAAAERAAKEMEGKAQGEKQSLETKVASLESKVRDLEATIQSASQEKQSVQGKQADLETKLKETTSKLAEYTHLYQAAEVKLSAQEEELSEQQAICLPPVLSRLILSNYARVKPVVVRAVTKTKDHTGRGYQFAVDFSQRSYEQAKPKVVEVMEQLCPLCDAAIDKYRSLIEAAARKIVIGASGVPQLAEYIHQGTEDMIVNTLLFTPVVTFAYLLLSSFLGVGGKGKKRKNRKQPHLASPGKPAFKPSGSPFRPTPPKNKRK